MICDGDCGFCRRSVEWMRQITGDRIAYAPSQEVGSKFPQIPPERFAHAVQLVEPDGRISQGADAVFRALASRWHWAWLRWLYRHVPGAAPISEVGYRWVARHRGALAGGACSIRPPPRYTAVRWLFLRALGVVFFIAFWSLGSQVIGLVGNDGILPAEQFLKAAENYYGPEKNTYVPTLCWYGASDATLTRLCTAGEVLSLLLILDIAPAFVLLLLWITYLSLASVCQVFLHFQWDILLL